jgi:arabinan endo-1,5-alpha-L-arabinosidase
VDQPPLRIGLSVTTATELVQGQPIASQHLTKVPFLYQYAEYVYIFCSHGSCCGPIDLPVDTVYRIEVCRATSVAGPYSDKSGKPCLGTDNRSGTIVLASNGNGTVFAPGSLGILDDPVEGRVMYYQYFNKFDLGSVKRRFRFNYLAFDQD